MLTERNAAFGRPGAGFRPWPYIHPGPQVTLPSLVLPRPGDSIGALEVSQASGVLRWLAAVGVRLCRGVRSQIISRRACRPYGRRDVTPSISPAAASATACSASPPKMSTWQPTPAPTQCGAYFSRVISVGMQFGVCLVAVNGQAVEVATFRADGHSLDGRHPRTVHFNHRAGGRSAAGFHDQPHVLRPDRRPHHRPHG